MRTNTVMVRLAVALLLASPILALNSERSNRRQDTDIPERFKDSVLHITGEINGVPINHTGTIQEVYAQLDEEDNSFKLSDLAAMENEDALDEQYHKREMTDVNCWPVPGQTHAQADGPAVIKGIGYLRGKGEKTCHLGPQSCTRVSCSYDAAIYLCNNNEFDIAPQCKTIGDYAVAINNKCRRKYRVYETHRVGGQAWDRGNWNVYIRKDNC